MTKLRLLPVLVFGLVSLLTIKVLTLAIGPTSPESAPDDLGTRLASSIGKVREIPFDDAIITGSTGARDGEAKDKKAEQAGASQGAGEKIKPKPAKPEVEGMHLPAPANTLVETRGAPSPAERALLEKLKERRDSIEARDRDLDLRDSLLRATERKLDEKIDQLRSLEGGADNPQNAKSNDPRARYRPLVTMYETMKPKEAARVFDRLETRVLLELVNNMNPRKMAEILAVMEPAAAERLTIVMARQAAGLSDQPGAQQDGELARLPTRSQGAGSAAATSKPVAPPRPLTPPKAQP